MIITILRALSNRRRNANINLDEIVHVTCKHRQEIQLDKYGKVFTDEDIKKVTKDVQDKLIKYGVMLDLEQADKVVDAIKTTIKTHELRVLYKHDVELALEYGM